MNICFINLPIEYYSPVSGGAIATIIYETTRELIAAGHDVTVLTPVNSDPAYTAGKVVPVDARRRCDLNFIQRRMSQVRQAISAYDWPYYEYFLDSVLKNLLLQKTSPEAVIAFNDLYLSASIRKLLPKTKVCVWLQNECRTNRKTLEGFKRSTDIIFTCSQYIADWTASNLGFVNSKIRVAHSGVDASVFHPRDVYTDTRAVPRVLFLGRIDPNKGPDLVIAAVKALKEKSIAVDLTLAGGVWFYGDSSKDPFYQSLTEAMKSFAAEPLGHVPREKVPGLVRDHDIVCVLSRSQEPFGLVALEAMASGCAVLASNRGGLPEACGGAAVLVDPDDQTAVYKALERLVCDPAFLAETKRHSIERASKGGWDVAAKTILASLH